MNDLTIVMLSEAKHPRKRITTDISGKQTGHLCFGDFMVDAHPAIPSWPKDSQHCVQDDKLGFKKSLWYSLKC